MRKLQIAVLSALTLAMGCLPSKADEFKWRLFGPVPVTHEHTKHILPALKRIQTRTNGRLTIRFSYYGETPYKATDALSVMKDGLVDIAEWSPGRSAATYPLLGGPELPFLANSFKNAVEAQAATNRAWDSPSVKAAVDKVLDDVGAFAGARYYYEPANLWVVKPVQSVEGLRDKKIRVFQAEQADFLSQLGASPVSMDTTEVYAALQRNVLDGVITGAGSLPGTKWNEVLRGGYITNMHLITSLLMVSKKSYDKLPSDIQGVLKEELANLGKELQDFVPTNDAKIQGDGKLTIVTASPSDYAKLRESAAKAVWPAWKKRVGDEGEKAFAEIEKALNSQ